MNISSIHLACLFKVSDCPIYSLCSPAVNYSLTVKMKGKHHSHKLRHTISFTKHRELPYNRSIGDLNDQQASLHQI